MTPTISEYVPIPAQLQLHRLLRSKDYKYKGVLEVLLSGSVGCLTADAPVETASGIVPICDIRKSDFVLAHHDESGRFCFAQGSGAFPKGKGNLYRVVSEHGEFVANEHHLVFSSLNVYQRVGDLYCQDRSFLAPCFLAQKHRAKHRLMSFANVLHCWETIVSLTGHCVKRIHQCGLQLPVSLENALETFPLSTDAQEFGLFYVSHERFYMDGQPEQGLTLSHLCESTFRHSMLNFFHQVEHESADGASACSPDGLKFDEHTLLSSLTRLLYQTHNAHPQDLLFFLSKFLFLLLSSCPTPPLNESSNTTYRIEKLTKDDWYFDMKIPNCNNYIAAGALHHNSSKSVGLAHELVMQGACFKNAHIGIFRKDMPALKDTILKTTLDHMGTDLSYGYNKTRSQITLSNNSTMTALSWGDGHIKKFRSYEFDVSGIEEGTENETQDFYTELYQRHGRRKWFKRPAIIMATNPDSPSHWIYKHHIDTDNPNRVVIYSRTMDNPHLSPEYINGLKANLTHKEVRRQLYGEWIEISQDVVYYAYNREKNFISKSYEYNLSLPIDVMFDFNIGVNKPMSAAIGQFDGKYHIAKDFVIQGARTADICAEIIEHLKTKQINKIRLYGDATGAARDTRNNRSDWDIILHAFQNAFTCKIEYLVPKSNPPIRNRHNIVNAQFLNALNQINAYIYQDAKVADEGFRLTQLRKSSTMVEDDSKPYQHITTSVGYWIWMNEQFKNNKSRLL